MLDWIIRKFQEQRIRKFITSHPVIIDAAGAIERQMKEMNNIIKVSDETKSNIKEGLMMEAFRLIGSDSPIMNNRQLLVPAVINMAAFQVLILPSSTENEPEVTGLRGRPGISGELKASILDIARKDSYISSLFANHQDLTRDIVYDSCLGYYWGVSIRTNFFQSLRITFDDYFDNPDRDWFRPFVEAMCAYKEAHYRELLSMPDILDEQSGLAPCAALKYSTFADIILSGERDPRSAFDQRYRRIYHEANL